MSSPMRFSPRLSWKRILSVFFLPLISAGFAPRATYKEKKKLPVEEAGPKPQESSRFNWSHLTPLELKDRLVGLQTQSTPESSPHFTLEGHKFLIFGGSIHYFRVPRGYWRDRLLKLQACGFNTVTTYVPWNLHEPQRGTFDFSGNLDLEAFVWLAAEVGLWVILRPGPYICSEIDLGGLPSWLLQDPELRLRTADQGFVQAVDRYFDHLIARVLPLQYRQGGPVIAVQVENEYGAFAKDWTYMPYLHQALLSRGIVELLLTSDAEKDVLEGSIEGVLATININSFQKDTFMHLETVQIDKPIMIMEYWVGWFDTWGGKHKVKNADAVIKTVSEFIKSEISFNTYMFHGGTNFGFINGAMDFGEYSSVVTSYDYDAVLTEAGDYTEKYFELRKLLGSVLASPLPALPALIPKAVYPPVRPSLYLPLWDALQHLNEPVISSAPVNMESLPVNAGNGQSYGFVLYETRICSGGLLRADVRDAAQVFLNETRIGTLDDGHEALNIPAECQLLRILVENRGRVNYSWKIQEQRKGVTGPVTINGTLLEGFTIYSLEMKTSFFERLRSAAWRPVSNSSLGPAFYLGTLRAGPSPRDTFLRLPIIVFERSKSGSSIQTTDTPKLETVP
uniref:Beta-galactosidase n=1 Tax=Pipistrellus kuhlii TaxID=59472 RepID=A0A7J7UFV9_PIPKU|nr:galactosidase beta 1 like 3 [Pipistrellus kuhlii]